MRIRINRLPPSRGRGGLECARPSSSPGHQPLAEVRISTSAPPASRRSRKFPPGTVSSIRRGQEGARPSSSPGHRTLAEVRISTFAPPAARRSRNCPLRNNLLLSKRSGGRPALQLPRISFPHRSLAYLPHSPHMPQYLQSTVNML